MAALALIALVLVLYVPVRPCFDATVSINPDESKDIDIGSLSAVTIDVCLLKKALNLSDPLLVTLTQHLSTGQSSVLRVGGTDENNWEYNLSRRDLPPPCDCGSASTCTLTGAYWDGLVNFANTTQHHLLFGMNKQVDQAASLIRYISQHQQSLFALSFSNELKDARIIDGFRDLRTLINNLSSPLQLVGPDLALQRHAPLEQALADTDPTILSALTWAEEFIKGAGPYVDAISFHTYDFHPYDFGSLDHHAFVPSNINASKFYDTRYLDMAQRLTTNMSTRVAAYAPHAKLWLSETNSICHQGMYGATNAYLNSLWLVNRVGLMAWEPVMLMARQSLIGYNYSLLGNYPEEPIKPNPDYFTTLLLQKLIGSKVLSTHVALASHLQSTAGDQLRAFAFCHATQRGAVTLALINFDASESSTVRVPGQSSWTEYVLRPDSTQQYPYTARDMTLNGQLLAVDGQGTLPSLEGVTSSRGSVELSPLSFAFIVLDVQLAHCQ